VSARRLKNVEDHHQVSTSTRKAYPDFGGSTREKTSGAASVSGFPALRRVVSDSMVRIHLIPPDLAEYHVSQMDDEEVLSRFKLYAEMELSAVGPTLRGEPISTRFLASPTTTADRTALSPVPPEHPCIGFCGVEVIPCSLCPFLPESEEKNRVRGRRRSLPPQAGPARVGNKKPGIAGHAQRCRPGEGFLRV
jgi:hypothetical protein